MCKEEIMLNFGVCIHSHVPGNTFSLSHIHAIQTSINNRLLTSERSFLKIQCQMMFCATLQMFDYLCLCTYPVPVLVCSHRHKNTSSTNSSSISHNNKNKANNWQTTVLTISHKHSDVTTNQIKEEVVLKMGVMLTSKLSLYSVLFLRTHFLLFFYSFLTLYIPLPDSYQHSKC